MKSDRATVIRLGLVVLSSVVLSACAVKPDPLTLAEQRLQLAIDREMARKDVERLDGPLTLEEATARAIKYNLDHRVRMMEQAVALGQLDLSRFDMWPQAMATAGYTTRNKPLITEATNSVTGEPSLSDPFISSDQSYWDLSLGLSWSLLDFGAGYYNAKQNADRLLIAQERRRRSMHLLMVDVQNAYWRAASAQALRDDIVRTVRLAEQALRNAKKLESSNTRQPIDAVKYQKNLLENLRNIDIIQNELSSAQLELANLINLPPSTEMTFAPPSFKDSKTRVTSMPIEKLEEVALVNNADLRETFYDVRITAAETRKAMLRLLPGVNLNWGPNYTNNSYVINQAWNAGAVSLSWNMLNALMIPSVQDQGDAEQALSVQRRMAMQMNVLGQVHLARLQYENALRVLDRSKSLVSVDRKIENYTIDGKASGTHSDAEVVAARTVSIISTMRRYQAVAQLYAANGRLQASLGFEPNLGDVQNTPLSELTAQVGQAMQSWRAGDGIENEIAAIERAEKAAAKADELAKNPDKLATEAVEAEAVETEAAETEAVETKPVNKETVESKSTESGVAETEAVETEVVETEVTETETAETETAETESEDSKTGWFAIFG
ncbi:MAG: TolC family protein [Orrella sp.]